MTRTSTFMPDIFHYCDRWCDRCPFQERCTYRQELRHVEEVCLERSPVVDAWLFDRDWDLNVPESLPSWMSPSDRRAFCDVIERADQTLSDQEYERKETALADKSIRVLRHPLTRAGAAYEDVVRNEIEQLHDQIYPTGESQPDQALEAIARYAVRIRSLTARAAGGLTGGLFGERDEDLRGVQSDANGCAKLLRLLIAESRDGWNLLSGYECVANVEGHMLWHLYRIDDLVQEYFPRAMAFVRPGFDGPCPSLT